MYEPDDLRARLATALNETPIFDLDDTIQTVMTVLTETGGDLRERIAEHLHDAWPHMLADGVQVAVADAVVEIVGPKLERLAVRAEKAEAELAEMDHDRAMWRRRATNERVEWERARTERDEALAAIERVRWLHAPVAACHHPAAEPGAGWAADADETVVCRACRIDQPYPCDTARALGVEWSSE